MAEHRRQIDMTLDEHSTGWKVRRMGVVDRNILRIAAWEILFTDDVPDKVAIDEALALAKTCAMTIRPLSSMACCLRCAPPRMQHRHRSPWQKRPMRNRPIPLPPHPSDR